MTFRPDKNLYWIALLICMGLAIGLTHLFGWPPSFLGAHRQDLTQFTIDETERIIHLPQPQRAVILEHLLPKTAPLNAKEIALLLPPADATGHTPVLKVVSAQLTSYGVDHDQPFWVMDLIFEPYRSTHAAIFPITGQARLTRTPQGELLLQHLQLTHPFKTLLEDEEASNEPVAKTGTTDPSSLETAATDHDTLQSGPPAAMKQSQAISSPERLHRPMLPK